MRRAIRRAGCGSSWGRAAASPEVSSSAERGFLVLGDRSRVGRPAAEPRDRLGPVHRAGDGRAPVAGVGDDLGRQRQRRRAQPGDRCDLLLERDDGELGVLRLARRERQREVAFERPRPQQQVGGAARRRGLRDVDERPDRRGGEQPRALAHRVGVRPQHSRDRHDRHDRVLARREDDGHRELAAGARERELALGAVELVSQQGAQLGHSIAGRGRPAGLLERRGERVHGLERRAGGHATRARRRVGAFRFSRRA